MKNNIKVILFIVLMCPFFINAAEVSLDCPSSTKKGAQITCKININSSETVVGFQANISASSGLTYKSYTKSSGWAGTSSSSKFLIYDNAITGKKTLGTYTYKVNTSSTEKLTVSLSGISVSNSNGGKISSNQTASDTIRIMETDNSLKDLTINGTTVLGFNKDTLSYTYKTEESSIKIGATKNNSYATISGTGTKKVNYGTNTYNVVVTSESGSKKTYKITVTRPDNRETINTLNSLGVENYTITPTFNKTTLNYTLSVESNVDKVKVSATKTSSKSTFVNEYGPREVKLNYGKNTIYIKVKSENEKINTYTITITRKDNRSSNNNLKTLTPSLGQIKFEEDVLEYSIVTDKDKISFTAEPQDLKSKVSGNTTYTLKTGVNEIKIVVTAENETTKTYFIKVTKIDDISSLNISNSLKELSMFKKYQVEFDKDKTEYNLTIGDEKELELDYKLDDEYSTVEVLGNKNLKDGSVITIKLTSIDGKTKEYKINIAKEKTIEEKSNTFLYLIIIISVILNVVLTILVLKKKKTIKEGE